MNARDGELDSAYAGLIHPEIFFNNRATAVGVGQKANYFDEALPFNPNSQINYRSSPTEKLTDTREVSSSPITLVDLNFPLVLESFELKPMMRKS